MKIRGAVVGTPIKPEKVLVKSEKLTEEEKAIARNNIGAVSALYIILVTGILVIHILVLWAFYKKKGQDQLQE